MNRSSSFVKLRAERLESREVPAMLVGLTTNNHLLTFDSSNPAQILRSVRIVSTAAADQFVGIDFRQANGQLYGATRTGLFTINMLTGLATRVLTTTNRVLVGNFFGVDINVASQLRIVSDADINLRTNLATGATHADHPLAFAADDVNANANPNVVEITSAANSTTAPVVFGIDSSLDALVRLNSPNTGMLRTVGGLGVNTASFAGFDVAQNGTAFASLTPVTSNVVRSQLFSINLMTGAATLIGTIGGPATTLTLIRGLAAIGSNAGTPDNDGNSGESARAIQNSSGDSGKATLPDVPAPNVAATGQRIDFTSSVSEPPPVPMALPAAEDAKAVTRRAEESEDDLLIDGEPRA